MLPSPPLAARTSENHVYPERPCSWLNILILYKKAGQLFIKLNLHSDSTPSIYSREMKHALTKTCSHVFCKTESSEDWLNNMNVLHITAPYT